MPFIAAINTWFKKQYALDLRALALMRIGVAAILITDLVIRVNSLTAHYTDAGVLPVQQLNNYYGGEFFFSLNALSEGTGLQIFLFTLAFVCAFMLLLGLKTRLVTLLSWFLLCSLQNRNPLIEQGGDDLIRIILFWGIFLPWGTRYSADRIKRGNEAVVNTYFGIPALGFALLVFSVYFFSSLLKTSPEWHSDGTALYYALSLDQLVLPLGKAIYPYPGLLKFLTHLAYYTELIAPFLLFIPVFNPFFRTAGIIAVICLHLGFSVFLFVGLFYLIGIVTAIGLLPPTVMNKLERRFAFLIRVVKKRVTVFFSGKNSASLFDRFSQFTKQNFYFGLLSNCVLLFFIAYCLLWNIGGVPGSGLRVSDNFRWLGKALRFEQCWNMFSPAVLKEDGWYVLEGITNDSLQIDLNRNGADVDFNKPESVLALIDNDRWRKFGEAYMQESNAHLRIHYCKYSINKWNAENPGKKVKQLNVIYVRETTEPDYKPVRPRRDVLCSCEGNIAD